MGRVGTGEGRYVLFYDTASVSFAFEEISYLKNGN